MSGKWWNSSGSRIRCGMRYDVEENLVISHSAIHVPLILQWVTCFFIALLHMWKVLVQTRPVDSECNCKAGLLLGKPLLAKKGCEFSAQRLSLLSHALEWNLLTHSSRRSSRFRFTSKPVQSCAQLSALNYWHSDRSHVSKYCTLKKTRRNEARGHDDNQNIDIQNIAF